MKQLGFKFFKDSDLNYELTADDLTPTLNSIANPEQSFTIYFGAWDDFDPATQKMIRKRIILDPNDTLLWTIVRFEDDGQGGKIEVPAVEFIKNISVTAPDEEDVIELTPYNPVANFYYIDENNKHLTSDDDYILYGNFNVGEYKFGWSTSSNAEAGGFRLAKRDPNDPSREIIMTRRIRYGDDVSHPDRFTTFQHGDDLRPFTDGWYVKDFWAYTYPDDDSDDTQANDIIPRVRTIQSGVENAIRIDITFGIPEDLIQENVTYGFSIKILGLKKVSIDKIEL